jgi:Pyruvate/2-oxoacid:ferredoxin oxidoreductase gamma subunit
MTAGDGNGAANGQRVERIAGAGKGGAGLLTCLKTLGYSAAAKGWNMAYTSDYNPETRGGLVEGTLVVSSHEPVDNPVIDSFTAIMAFDLDAYESYGPRLEPGGTILWDSSKIFSPPSLGDVKSYGIPIFRLASDAGAARLANMAMLGLFNKLLGLFTVDDLIAGMESYLPVWRHKLIPGNRQVLETVTRMDVEPYRVGATSAATSHAGS